MPLDLPPQGSEWLAMQRSAGLAANATMARQGPTTKSRRETEQEIARQVQEVLQRRLPPDYVVHTGKSILYKIEVNALGQITPDSVNGPMRGQYAFQTDILVERRAAPAVPLVVIELKYGSFSSHDVITYSSKAARHKDIYPYLRYGFVVVGPDRLGRRFVTHNQGFDFAMALPDVAVGESNLVGLVERQLASAERLSRLMQHNRLSLSRYEETVDIGD
jgi:hypothetical protein